jgi:hypothetical protein
VRLQHPAVNFGRLLEMEASLSARLLLKYVAANAIRWRHCSKHDDHMLTFRQKINHRLNIPLNAIMVSLAIVALVSLINIGSSVALNAINSMLVDLFAVPFLV